MKTDVCLLLEGIYLHVHGGVSVWVDTLIRSLPELKFSIYHITRSEDIGKAYVCSLPSNVVAVKEVFPFEYETTRSRGVPARRRAEAWQEVERTFLSIVQGEAVDTGRLIDSVAGPDRALSTHDLSYSEEVWEILNRVYRSVAPDYSFVDFFWTWRFTQMPLMKLLDTDLPDANVYHAVSTGYAGLVGALAKRAGAKKLIVTEHGIYTRERNLEISQAEWIYSPQANAPIVEASQGLIKTWWQRMFAIFASIAYQHADHIVTLFEGNRLHQLAGGADPTRTMIVPNGIPETMFGLPHNNETSGTTVGFLGRVVPIKDLITFLRAAKIVADQLPDAQFRIMGATDEDPEYVTQCRQLTDVLGLNDRVTFTGPVDPKEQFPNLDVVVLTSLSEGQPLTVIEAMAAGVPVVTTRVGACEELVLGRTVADQALGSSGIVTQVSSPSDTAEAIVRIVTHRRLWEQMATTGRTRAETYYRMQAVSDRYRQLYTNQNGGAD